MSDLFSYIYESEKFGLLCGEEHAEYVTERLNSSEDYYAFNTNFGRQIDIYYSGGVISSVDIICKDIRITMYYNKQGEKIIRISYYKNIAKTLDDVRKNIFSYGSVDRDLVFTPNDISRRRCFRGAIDEKYKQNFSILNLNKNNKSIVDSIMILFKDGSELFKKMH